MDTSTQMPARHIAGSMPGSNRWVAVRAAVISPLQLVPFALIPIYALARQHGWIADLPLWMLVGSVIAAQMASNLAYAVWPTGCRRWEMTARVGVMVIGIALAMYTTGWGAVFAFGYVFAAAENIRVDGSRVAMPAIVWMTTATACGQIAVGLGWVPTLLPEPEIHGVAVLAAFGSGLAIALLGWSAKTREDVEQSLRESEEHYRGIVDDQTELVCRYLSNGTITFVNQAYADFFGTTREEMLGATTPRILASHDPRDSSVEHPPTARGREAESEPRDWELRVDGVMRWLEWKDRPFFDDEGRLREFQSVGRDVTDQRWADILLAHQANLLDKIARGVPLVPTLTTLCEIVEEHAPGAKASVLLLDATDQVLRHCAAPSLPAEFVRSIDGTSVGRDGGGCSAAFDRKETVLTTDIAVDPLWDHDRDPALAAGIRACWSVPLFAPGASRAVGTLSVYGGDTWQLTAELEQLAELLAKVAAIAIESDRVAEELAHQSLHDALTGLPNRTLFLDRLEQALGRARRNDTGVAVLFLDLDRFKTVNDTYGHDVGDELLVELAGRLTITLRESDTLARFGGDEFTVLSEDLPRQRTSDHARIIARRISDATRVPFVTGRAHVFPSASIGISIGVGDERADELLRDADAAMYHAKSEGRNRVEVFDERLREDTVAAHATENELHHAIERGELRLFFQPIIGLRDGHCAGVEALVRWQHPSRGLVLPADFIEIAEESGLIVPLGAWVFDQAIQTAARWAPDVPQDFFVAINVSARQLGRDDLVTHLERTCARHRVDPQMLCLEITETALMEDSETALALTQDVRSLGCSLSVDDFGTGYSSLSYLKRYPVDSVKIDRSFVNGIGSDPEDSAIVAAIVGLAHALDLRVVAEGVETDAQLDHLVELGCDLAQGFRFAPPRPVVGHEDLLAGIAAFSLPTPR